MWRLVSQPEKINGTHTRLLAIVSHTGSIFSHNSRLAAWPQSASRIKFNITRAPRPAMCTPPSNARFLWPTQVCPQWHLHQFNHFCKAHQCAQDLETGHDVTARHLQQQPQLCDIRQQNRTYLMARADLNLSLPQDVGQLDWLTVSYISVFSSYHSDCIHCIHTRQIPTAHYQQQQQQQRSTGINQYWFDSFLAFSWVVLEPVTLSQSVVHSVCSEVNCLLWNYFFILCGWNIYDSLSVPNTPTSD